MLVIDDSAANRKSISRLLESARGIEVIDRAADGEEGLKKAIALRPDVITLDLEMPKLDGYSFLRLLMAKAPTPVIVLSSYNHSSDVFKALQLGAFDFVSKPAASEGTSLDEVRAELLEKVRSARFARREEPKRRVPQPFITPPSGPFSMPERATVVAIGASTGGPPAVQRVLESLSGLNVCVLVAQHMPARFTEAFALRLDATLPFRVSEAKSGDRIDQPHVYIAGGGTQLELVEARGGLALKVTPGLPKELHAPSVDVLFSSLAKTLGAAVKAVVLTGMGEDGAAGVEALGAAGAEIWAEAESSAVVFGMPQAAIDTGRVTHTLALDQVGPSLAKSIQRHAKSRRRT